SVRQSIERVRAEFPADANRVSIIHGLPESVPTEVVLRPIRLLIDAATADGVIRDARVLVGGGFVGVDVASDKADDAVLDYANRFTQERLRTSEFHPDSWPAVVIRNPADTAARLMASAGDKYTYRELDDYTDLLVRALKTLPIVSKVARTGLLS